MDSNDILARFNALPTTMYPPYPPQPVVVNGDRWAGELVVRVSDLLALVGELVRDADRRATWTR